MKRIAVLGAESFLARNFIQYSIENNLEYEFELYGHTPNNIYPNLRYTLIDFGDIEDLKRIDLSADAIMVFIGRTGTTIGFKDYRSFIEVNEIMLLNILKAYVDLKSTARIIYPSSRLLFKSNEKEMINENSPKETKSIYAVTKLAAEEYLRIYNETFGVNSVIIRICTPIGSLLKDYGSYGTFEIFKNQALKNGKITIFGDGAQRKTFTFMRDICKAFSLLIDKNKLKHNDYNLGGQNLTLLNIAKCIAKEYNVPIEYVEWPKIDKKVDGGTVIFDSSRFDLEFDFSYSMFEFDSVEGKI